MIAVTSPLDETVAAAEFDDVQVTGRSTSAFPLASFGVAESCTFFPTINTFSEGVPLRTTELTVPFGAVGDPLFVEQLFRNSDVAMSEAIVRRRPPRRFRYAKRAMGRERIDGVGGVDGWPSKQGVGPTILGNRRQSTVKQGRNYPSLTGC